MWIYGHAVIKYAIEILLDKFVLCPFSHFSTQCLWVMGKKIKMVFFHFRAHTRIPWNSWWPVGIFASPSGKSVLNIMPFLDFSKNPNQSQSLFSSVEGHHFVSGKDSASRLTVCHVNIFPKTYLGYCLSQLLCCTVRRWGESQPLDADGLFAGIIPAGSWQTLTVLHLNVS